MSINIPQLFLKQAKEQRRKIAIAILRPIPETIASLKKASKFADLTIVGSKIKDFKNITEADSEKASDILLTLLKEKKVDGIVRGQVKDSYTLNLFYKKFKKKPVPSARKLFEAIFHKGHYTFFIATSSVYQGLTLKDKLYEVENIAKHMQETYGIEAKIAIMSSLRPTSQHGKYILLDKMYKINAELNKKLQKKGYNSKEYYFEYEKAVWERRNLIVPSMGLVGNAWMKALLYLGDWQLLATNYINLGEGIVYEDGSRYEKDFFWHIVHAVALCNKTTNK